MKATILLDLDDTLLGNDIDAFLPVYMQAISKAMKGWAEPRKFIAALLAGTERMVANRQPDCTLKEIFDGYFYPALGIPPEEIRPEIDRFYAEVFPTLKGLTHQRPEAVALVETALDKGYRLAVTTNPLFPRTAVLQRLEWAGLQVEKYPFELVSSYETFHFAKPHPAFYAEVLGRLGWPEGPVVVAGDSLANDIIPSRQLGLQAYWIEKVGQASPEGSDSPSARGGLAGLLPWIESSGECALKPEYGARPPASLATLRATPAVLRTLCDDLPAAAWSQRPTPGEWSPVEIVCHLRDVDREVNLPRLHKVMSEDNPFLPGEDTDPWAEERQYIRQDGPQALHRFTAVRLELLGLLERLHPGDWQRPARHAIFSRTQLAELIGISASHDRLHVQQMIAATGNTG